MSYSYSRFFLLLLAITFFCGCSYYQPTKDVWKSTKGLWNTYVSPPASVDYEEKGALPSEALALANSMMGIDNELSRLERAMQNADKPPTQAWLDKFFADFPWVNGFAGVKYDGTILGQQPEDSIKKLDFIPLLYEDKRQNSRALRADVDITPFGPEVMLATPLYDGVDFLGIVVTYFEMRSLMRFSKNSDDIVVLCPLALLWAGKYDFAATPLAGVDWAKVVRESSAGKCSNSNGVFYYMVRYLGNLPLVFAIAEKGNFPTGDGNLEQGLAFFPKEKEKLPPPPMPERKSLRENAVAFEKPEEPEPAEPQSEITAQEGETGVQQPARQPGQRDPNEIAPGSRDSVLLKGGRSGRKRQIEERQLEGENVEVERIQRPRVPARPKIPEPELDLIPDTEGPTLPGGRPSPFGPRESSMPQIQRPSPFGPAGSSESPQPETPEQATPDTIQPEQPEVSSETPAVQEKPAENAEPQASDETDNSEPRKPALLPGGRPSPFGPRN